MKNLLNISEEEKSRILEMHQPNGYKKIVENQNINEGLDMSKMKDFTGLTSKQLNDCIMANKYPVFQQIQSINDPKDRSMVMNSCSSAIKQNNNSKALECGFFITRMTEILNAGAIDKTWIKTAQCIQSKIEQGSMKPSTGSINAIIQN